MRWESPCQESRTHRRLYSLFAIQESAGVYDAEHFFDGYKANPDYALQTIRRAIAGGAERVILCDTNGGTMPWEIREICRVVKQECPAPLGIHAHNDSEMAVANSLVAGGVGICRCRARSMALVNGVGMRICARSFRTCN